MHLPPIALAIIREYSRPVTRPDWKNLNRLPLHKLYKEIMYKKTTSWKYTNIMRMFIYDIQRGTRWSELYEYSKKYGMKACSDKFGIQYKELENILIVY